MLGNTTLAKQKITSFIRDTAGQFAIMAALGSSAIITGVAVSVDGSMSMSSKAELQDVADAISLAAIRQDVKGKSELETLANDYIQSHYKNVPFGDFEVKAIVRNGDAVEVDLAQAVSTPFYKILSGKPMTLRVTSTAQQTMRNLDISLVLDNTGSMRGPKLDALKVASNDLVDILYKTESGKKGTQIGLVPFASWVNVGRENMSARWLDQNGVSPQNATYFDQQVSRFDLYNQMNVDWNGCVENRLPPYDVDDTAPDPRKPETLFQPAFHPDMSDLDGGGYSYLADTTGGGHLDRLKGSAKYNTVLDFGAEGPAKRSDDSCNPRRKITPLTNNERKIRNGIRNMYAAGWTNIANGASWGFRVVSPNAPFTEGRPYEDKTTEKAMVILTDGMQTMGGASGSEFRSGYSPFGFLGEPAVNGQKRMNGGNVKDALDRKLVEVCRAAKAKKITIYSITFELDDDDTQDVMRACATDPGKYFDVASAAELSPVFKEIAASLTDLRIAQ